MNTTLHESNYNANFDEQDTFDASMSESGDLYADFGDVQIVSTGNYNELYNKPKINDVELQGNKTFTDLGDKTLTNIEIKQIFDRVFKGGQ